MVKKILIAGRKRNGDYILRYKGSNTFHRVPAKSLLEAKAKMLKGTRYKFSDIEQITPIILRKYKLQGGTNL